PYTAAAFSELLGRVRAAAAAKLGNAQLYALQTGAAEGKRLFLNYLLYQIVRNRKRYEPWLEALAVDLAAPGRLEELFIHRTPTGTEATWIPDALQLSPFIDKKMFLDKTRGARS
ncbi:MAG: hypothetical protein GY856_11575, partial [bacterium]|nr:hypothetical protein [bacterium]